MGVSFGADAPDAPHEKKIQDLEARLEALEAERSEAKPTWLEHLKILGFADVTYGQTQPSVIGRDVGKRKTDAFSIGQLDLTFVGKLPQRFSFLSENLIKTGDTAASTFTADRLQIKYDYSDALQVAVGRSHTAFGWWNHTLHNGRILYAPISRPGIFAFEGEGGLLPVHSVGVEATGRIPAPGMSLNYVASLGNGRGATADSIQGSSDANRHKAYLLNIGVEPNAARGLLFGGSYYADLIPEDTSTAGRERPIDETILGLYSVYRGGSWMTSLEFFHLEHQDRASEQEFGIDMGYFMTSYQFKSGWQPYYCYERAKGSSAPDPFFSAAGIVTSYEGHAVGIGYRFTPQTVVKLELDKKNAEDNTRDETGIKVQLAVSF